ncbi:MAG: M24 family metallopeptidase, partial [Candidatus Thermoplasmatota archaeon]
EKAIKVIKHGKEIGEIDRTARNVIKEYGYSRYYVHGTGHGVGIEVHELPRIVSSEKMKIEKGIVFTVEPGIYIPKKGGVRIEDMVYVGDSVKVITRAVKKL